MSDEPFIPARLVLEDYGVSTAGLLELEVGPSALDQMGVRAVGIVESQFPTEAQFTVGIADELRFCDDVTRGYGPTFGLREGPASPGLSCRVID